MNKRAFTLIELLVVIAIVGIMMSIITPVIGRAREMGRRSQCSNSLRQIGMAIHMYIDDYDLKFPPLTDFEPAGDPRIRWFHYIAVYLDDTDVFDCPNYKYHVYGDYYHFSYGYNYNGLNEPWTGTAYPGRDINWVNRYSGPSLCMMVTSGGFVDGTDEPTRSRCYVTRWTVLPIPRHSDGVNVLYVDGHSAWRLGSDIPLVADPGYRAFWNY